MTDDDELAAMVLRVLREVRRLQLAPTRKPQDKVTRYCPPEARYDHTGRRERRTA